MWVVRQHSVSPNALLPANWAPKRSLQIAMTSRGNGLLCTTRSWLWQRAISGESGACASSDTIGPSRVAARALVRSISGENPDTENRAAMVADEPSTAVATTLHVHALK
jgi:hypothetical protein